MLTALIGPTAVGKSALSLRLAELLNAEILMMDSMVVYRRMNVGTDKPDAEARQRVVHHGMDQVEPSERFDTGRWMRMALPLIRDLDRNRRNLLLVGGTMLYYRSLVEGFCDVPPISSEVTEQVRSLSDGEVHSKLLERDPERGQRLHPHDRQRTGRALEVVLSTGRTLKEFWDEGKKSARPIPTLVLTREDKDLRERIRTRIDQMLANGWKEEVDQIRSAGGFSDTAAEAAGYSQILEGEQPLPERIFAATWYLARKQKTWLRHFEPPPRLPLKVGEPADPDQAFAKLHEIAQDPVFKP